MSDTVKLNNCPKCGAPIPADAPQGLCPKCVLLGATAATDAGAPPTATAEIPSLERVAAAFPQFEVLELIGRGGMSFVFKARQPHLGRFVALKLLPDKLARDPRFAERFNREGRVLARLNHPNIVSVYDFGMTEHFYFLVMEFVDGVNLRQAMQAGRFSPAEALAIVPKICEALQYAHSQGILHRDIKPENILLDARGQVKIADFGIAKLVGEEKPDVTLTGTGAAIGTPHYMAPEQLEKPGEVDHRADIYSLGVVFYEMLTGELPIGRFAPPSSKTPVGAAVDEVVFRTLEKDRERRYQSAGEMKQHVEHLTDADMQPTSVPAAPLDNSDVAWPAKALIATGVFNWIASIGVIFFLVFTHVGRTLNLKSAPLELVCFLIFVLSSLIIVGGLKMLRLESYPMAITGSIFAMFTSPGSLIGFPVGIWALLTLRQPKVRAAFERNRRNALPPKVPGTGAVPVWSQKAIWAGVLTALSLPLAVPLTILVYLRIGGLGGLAIVGFGVISLPGLVGFVLGWTALSDIRAHQGKLRGLPLALFAALAWPLFLLLGITLTVPWLMVHRSAPGSTGTPLASILALLVPVGTLTFAIWAVYAAARWGANKPPSERRGVLKWVFIALLLAGIGFVVTIVPARRTVSYHSVGELSFGPVHETVLPEPGPGVACLLDFETGNLLTPSDELAERLRVGMADIGEEAAKLLRESGADVVVNMPNAGSLRLFEGVALSVAHNPNPPLRWNEFTPAEVVSALGQATFERNRRLQNSDTTFYGTPALSPDALAFITREGSMGVMEIIGLSQNPRGVKLRYKLIKSSSARLAPPPTAEMEEFLGREVEVIVGHLFSDGEQLALERKGSVTLPEDAKEEKWGRTMLLHWLADEGVDLGAIYYDDDQFGWGLAMRPTTRFVRQSWSTIDAEILRTSLAGSNMPLEKMDGVDNRMNLYRLHPKSLPLSFAIRTAAGRLAALQITTAGVTNNLPILRVRYKLATVASFP